MGFLRHRRDEILPEGDDESQHDDNEMINEDQYEVEPIVSTTGAGPTNVRLPSVTTSENRFSKAKSIGQDAIKKMPNSSINDEMMTRSDKERTTLLARMKICRNEF